MKKNLRTKLETWSVGKLGAVYINHFTLSKKNSEEASKLEMVTEILSRRSMKELRDIYLHICGEITSCCKKEDYERAELFKKMKQHFHRYIFN